MGNTVESYRIALEAEINKWKGFAWALRKDDREAFEDLMDMSRGFTSEASNVTNPILFEPFVMSILLALQKRILILEQQLGIKQQAGCISEPEQAASPRKLIERYLNDMF